MSRRNILLASTIGGGEDDNEEVLPESTEFGFPLYLNTTIIYDDGSEMQRSRPADELGKQFYEWIVANDSRPTIGGFTLSKALLNNNPVYIDGKRLIEGTFGMGNSIILSESYCDEYEMVVPKINNDGRLTLIISY